jgi:broad specificity phosphatase PhoE
MSKARITIIFFVVIFLNSCESKALDLYFVRHAQTVANVTGKYSDSNQRKFTAKGERQREQLVERLAPYAFDDILVSPLYRARATIQPYLKFYNRRGELWPEFAECCWQNNFDQPAVLPLRTGKEIILMEEDQRYFSFRDPDSHYFYNTRQRFADGLAQLKKGVALVEKRYANTEASVLIVAHAYSIATAIHLLLDRPWRDRPPIANAAISHLNQNADGTYRLVMLNR